MADPKSITFGVKIEISVLRTLFKHPGKVFHTSNKKIGGKRISLTNSILPLKETIQIPINNNRKGSSLNTLYKKTDKTRRETH
jgi:hypothetical protein